MVTVAVIALGWWLPYLGLLCAGGDDHGHGRRFLRRPLGVRQLVPARAAFSTASWPGLPRTGPRPKFLKKMSFRWGVFAAMMALMIGQLAMHPATLANWGHVFWIMCTLTTGIGIVLSLFMHARAWCLFCPVGTVARVAAPKTARYPDINEACRACGLCDKACPMDIEVSKIHQSGVGETDCIRCGQCAQVCKINLP